MTLHQFQTHEEVISSLPWAQYGNNDTPLLAIKIHWFCRISEYRRVKSQLKYCAHSRPTYGYWTSINHYCKKSSWRGIPEQLITFNSFKIISSFCLCNSNAILDKGDFFSSQGWLIFVLYRCFLLFQVMRDKEHHTISVYLHWYLFIGKFCQSITKTSVLSTLPVSPTLAPCIFMSIRPWLNLH